MLVVRRVGTMIVRCAGLQVTPVYRLCEQDEEACSTVKNSISQGGISLFFLRDVGGKNTILIKVKLVKTRQLPHGF